MKWSLSIQKLTLIRICFLAFIFIVAPAHADDFETVGDVLTVVTPLGTAAYVAYLKDWPGMKVYGWTFGASMATTFALQFTTNEERPNGRGHSFPSGHTTAVAAPAAYTHLRYGLKKALLPLTATGVTAASRVEANQHHVHDVLASVGLSYLFAWVFTKEPYTKNKLDLLPVMGDYYGVIIRFTF